MQKILVAFAKEVGSVGLQHSNKEQKNSIPFIELQMEGFGSKGYGNLHVGVPKIKDLKEGSSN